LLLKTYSLEIFKSICQSDAKGVHCFAHLDQDVGKALPYLNSALGGFEYFSDPPAVTFKVHGKLITVHGKKIAVNALKDKAEAEKIVQWLQNEINSAWVQRDKIVPCYNGLPRPQIIEILKFLPKTNCRECKQPTCMVFAIKIAEGVKSPEECTWIKSIERRKLTDYMGRFNLDM